MTWRGLGPHARLYALLACVQPLAPATRYSFAAVIVIPRLSSCGAGAPHPAAGLRGALARTLALAWRSPGDVLPGAYASPAPRARTSMNRWRRWTCCPPKDVVVVNYIWQKGCFMCAGGGGRSTGWYTDESVARLPVLFESTAPLAMSYQQPLQHPPTRRLRLSSACLEPGAGPHEARAVCGEGEKSIAGYAFDSITPTVRASRDGGPGTFRWRSPDGGRPRRDHLLRPVVGPDGAGPSRTVIPSTG